MPSSTDQVRQELAAERERLGSAVQDLHAEVDRLKRKLPYIAAGAVAVVVVIAVVKWRFLR